MDASGYKFFATSRGLKYHYYFNEARDGKPYLVLLHGFPSWSKDWSNQVAFFKEKGYGLIVPDTLGNGRTDAPSDVTAYKMSLMAKDVVELADHENATRAIVIGHDWYSCILDSSMVGR